MADISSSNEKREEINKDIWYNIYQERTYKNVHLTFGQQYATMVIWRREYITFVNISFEKKFLHL